MSLFINNKGNVYEQIVNHYKKYISLNIIKENEKLPSCRVLASELGINPNTVEKAYSVLENEGYITSDAKKGFFVSYNLKKDKSNEINNMINEIKLTGISKDELISIINSVYKEG